MRSRKWLIAFILGWLFGTHLLFARSVPSLSGPVVDEVGVLSAEEKASLEQQLFHLRATGKAQMQVLLISSLEGEVLEDFSMRVAEAWKIGAEKTDNGLIILLAVRDRRVRIEVGQGMEGIITDLASRRIIQAMKPYLKDERYSEALIVCLREVKARLDKEILDDPDDEQESTKAPLILLLVFIGLIFMATLRRSGFTGGPRGPWGGGPWDGGGGSRGGGSWSGGGGGFSGGGSSDRW